MWSEWAKGVWDTVSNRAQEVAEDAFLATQKVVNENPSLVSQLVLATSVGVVSLYIALNQRAMGALRRENEKKLATVCQQNEQTLAAVQNDMVTLREELKKMNSKFLVLSAREAQNNETTPGIEAQAPAESERGRSPTPTRDQFHTTHRWVARDRYEPKRFNI